MAALISISMLCITSCKKSPNNSTTSDSATFLFHFHTQIIDSTIGGNLEGYDSNATAGSMNPWYPDSLGRRIELFVPQFFVSAIKLANANGTTLTLNNITVLKGLDSEDYYLCKVPAGTYTSATFTVGLTNADSTTPPSTSFIADGVPYPLQSSMWNGTDYYGMIITGAYDTSVHATGINPIPFTFKIPNSLTTSHQVVLPTRGTAACPYAVYLAIAGSTNYIHVLCDYGKLLAGIVNLKTNNSTVTNPSLADSLAGQLPNMFPV